jgi:hypothetical protein
MLAQILGKHGLPTRVAQHDAVTRAALATLDGGGVAIVAISYMEATGSPAHLRTLLRRLRQKMPNAMFVLGLWSSDAAPEPERDLRGIEGADVTTASIRDIVTLCVETGQRVAEGLPANDFPDIAARQATLA